MSQDVPRCPKMSQGTAPKAAPKPAKPAPKRGRPKVLGAQLRTSGSLSGPLGDGIAWNWLSKKKNAHEFHLTK